MDSPGELLYCRFCAEMKLFDDLLDLEENPEDIHACVTRLNILKIDFVNISSCKLPKLICEPCYNALFDAALFICKIKKAQIVLNELIDTKSEIDNQDDKSDIGEAHTHIGDNDTGDPDIEESSREVFERQTQKDLLVTTETQFNIDQYAIEDLNASVDSSEAREGIAKKGVATCTIINKNHRVKPVTPKYISRNLYDEDDLVEITDIGISNNPCPILRSHLESFLKDTEHNEFQNSCSKENYLNTISSSSKIEDRHGGNTVESDTLKSLLTDTTHDYKKLFQRLTHGDIKNASEDSFSKLSPIENNSDKTSEPSLLKEKLTAINISWSDYVWLCQHCNTKCNSMEDLREHSKLLHSKCCGYKCVDCPDPFITFTAFIEHARQHRPSLRLYCHFCNEQFPTPEACTIHSYNHWFENKTCDRCGEQLPDAESLMRHKGQFKKSLYPRKYVRRTAHFVAKDDTSTWDSYKCICQVCHLHTEDIATLRKHAEEVHVKCFVNKCFDCLYVPRDYKSFVNHVLQHRPWLKIPCPYCSVPFTRDNPPRKHLRQHETEHEKLCNKCGQMFQGNQFKEHVQKFNVQGHKLRLTCDVCFKEFNAKSNLRDHKAVKHGHIDHAHICEICGQSYKVKARLRQHMNTHLRKRNVCQYCQLCFPSPYALKKHVKTHLNLQDQYICDYCGICIKSKSHLRRHMTCHTSNKEMYKCQYCDKTFSQKEYRKTHEYLHTGKKTFQCQKCPLSFTNWGNCNKHMIRRHGITIAKTRRTTAGRLRVNETGDVVEVKDNVRKWLNDVASQAPCTKRK